MQIKFSPNAARVIGCLMEKEIATPDQYPLSLNALVNACNQKSNRHPVMALDEATVQDTVDELIKSHLIMEKTGFGSRVPKYKQRFCNTEFSELQFSPQETAVICELLLRGPQTPGELRGRAGRLCRFGDVREVEAALQGLADRDEPLVVKLPREPGRRDSRYAHLLSGEVDVEAMVVAAEASTAQASSDRERLDMLELRVDELMEEVVRLRQQVEALS